MQRAGEPPASDQPRVSGCDAAYRERESKRVFSFNLLPEPLKELSDVSETYFLTQLERGFYTLDFYKSLRLTGQDLQPAAQ